MRFMFLVLLALASPAMARDLPVPLDNGWQHAQTGLVLTPRIDGLPRTKLADLTASEHDIVAEFATPNLSTVITIFLYHPAVDDVTIWFERSEAALYDRSLFGDVSPASADPVPFAAPGSTTPNALRRVYSPDKGPYRGTGLAMMPLGEWLVAIRASSKDEGAAALDARLTRVIAALRWPANAGPAPALSPILACTAPLAFDGKAKRAKSQGADMLLSLLGGLAAAKAKSEVKPEPARWCRDPASAARFGVYRNMAYDKGYTLALLDAGRVVHVTPSLDTQMGTGNGYRMALSDVDGTTTSFPGFDRLPAPAQVFDALSGPRLGTSKGNQVTLDVNAL